MRMRDARVRPFEMIALSTFVLTLALGAEPAPEAQNKDVSGIVWINDDWAKAKAQAIEAGQLIAVDVWATWCHTCLSMKHFVLTEKPLADVSKQHTFLMLDFDRPENAAFFAKIAVPALPTFMVIDPKSQT